MHIMKMPWEKVFEISIGQEFTRILLTTAMNVKNAKRQTQQK